MTDRNSSVQALILGSLGLGLFTLVAGLPAVGIGLMLVSFVASIKVSGDDGTATGSATGEPEPGSAPDGDRTDEALDALRTRYARGELSEAQFERKLERLLETETVEDAEEALEGSPGRRNDPDPEGDAPDRSLETEATGDEGPDRQ